MQYVTRAQLCFPIHVNKPAKPISKTDALRLFHLRIVFETTAYIQKRPIYQFIHSSAEYYFHPSQAD